MKLKNIIIKSVSFIIPAMNEEETLEVLYKGISSQMEQLRLNYEVRRFQNSSE